MVWEKEVPEAAVSEGKALGTAVLSWQVVRVEVTGYVGKKTAAYRFNTQDNYDTVRVPTKDLLNKIKLLL